MLPRDLASLTTLLAVAEERSFTRAAKRKGVSPSAISHAMKGLEEELGIRLLTRTTRSVALTDAWKALVQRLQPALAEIGETLDQLSGESGRAAGRIRLLVPRLAVSSVLAPKLKELHEKYPEIVLDVTTDDNRRDIVAGGFDAGIHFGEYVEKDMIAVRVTKDQRAAIVGSPAYFKTQPIPKTPQELLNHRCINFRHGSTELYRWEFQKGKKKVAVGVSGPLIVDDLGLALRGAVDGVGLAFVDEGEIADELKNGTLVRVLEDWCQPYPGFFLYHPSRRQQTAALAAVIAVLRARL